MSDIRTVDWSAEVAPFWGAVIQTALTGQGLAGLLRAGWTTIKVRGCDCATFLGVGPHGQQIVCSLCLSVRAACSWW